MAIHDRIRSAPRLALAATLAALCAAAASTSAGQASTTPGSLGRSLAAATSGEIREVHETFTFTATWPALGPPGAHHRFSSAAVHIVPSAYGPTPARPFFRLLSADVAIEPSSTAIDSSGEEGDCLSGFVPTTCSRIHVRAHFTLTEPLGLQPIEPVDPPLWCVNLHNGSGGAISTLLEHIECQNWWVSSYWPETTTWSLGALPIWTLDGVTYARQDTILAGLASIELKLSTSAGEPCTDVPAAPAAPAKPGGGKKTGSSKPTLDPSVGIYDALSRLGAKDDRWDALFRRATRQRAALRRHTEMLEDTAYEIAMIYATLPADAVLTALPGWRALKTALPALRKAKNTCQAVKALRVSRQPLTLARELVEKRLQKFLKLSERFERLADKLRPTPNDAKRAEEVLRQIQEMLRSS